MNELECKREFYIFDSGFFPNSGPLAFVEHALAQNVVRAGLERRTCCTESVSACAGSFLSKLRRGLVIFLHLIRNYILSPLRDCFIPRLAAWAASFRRFAAGVRRSRSRLLREGFLPSILEFRREQVLGSFAFCRFGV
jgi:hypothetical protein